MPLPIEPLSSEEKRRACKVLRVLAAQCRDLGCELDKVADEIHANDGPMEAIEPAIFEHQRTIIALGGLLQLLAEGERITTIPHDLDVRG